MGERKYFIDWLRVLAFFLLILFHCAMPFVIFHWEIRNKEQYVGLTRIIWWLHQWRLPLLFFVSGVGVHFSLKKRTALAFAGERTVRLLIPLLFSMFFVIPLQVYFEKLQKGLIAMPYSKFYPQVWTFIPYPNGALSWSHLWFIVYLFVYCILLIPVFAIFKIKKIASIKNIVANKLAHPFGLLLLILPLLWCYFAFFLQYPEQMSLVDDWFLFFFSLILFFYGYFLASSSTVWETCERYRKLFLAIAIICIVCLFAFYWWDFSLPFSVVRPKRYKNDLATYGILNCIEIWFLILAAIGFAKKHLNFTNKFLQFTTQAVYPFYILHQTIIVAAGYYIVQLAIPSILKFILLVIITFGSVFLIYRFIIKPFIVTRILYGLKPKEKK